MQLSFNQARECMINIYEKRGYNLTRDFIYMLHKISLIELHDVTNLIIILKTIYEDDIEINEQKKLKKFKKDGTFFSERS